MDIPNINTLHIEKKIKDNIKNEMFNIVLKKCIEDINYANSFTDKTYIIFEVPNIIIGFHNYDTMLCINYLIYKFTKKEYLVQFMEPNNLYIDWGSNTSNSLIPISSLDSSTKLKRQTTELLKKYPTASKVVYVYDDKKKKRSS